MVATPATGRAAEPGRLCQPHSEHPQSGHGHAAKRTDGPVWLEHPIVFNYASESPGTITGFDCKVTDSNGQSVGPDMTLDFPASPNALTSSDPIGLSNLSRMVAFHVVLVGFYDSANAYLNSGGGSITVQSSTPLTVQTTWSFADTVGNGGIAENSNSTYGQLPACPSKSFTQKFGMNAT